MVGYAYRAKHTGVAVKLSNYQRVADALLHATHGKSLAIFVLDLDDQGVKPPDIARELADATDGAVHVTAQAIRNWLRQFRKDDITEPAA